MKIFEIVESKIEAKTAEDILATGEPEAYVSAEIFKVKYDEDQKKYVVFSERFGVRKKVGMLRKYDLDKKYTLVRPNEKPDAEGLLTYRKNIEVEAFRYMGNTTMVKLKKPIRINDGDFFVMKDGPSGKLYDIMSEDEFERQFIKK